MEDGEPVGGARDGIEAICCQVGCPVLVVQGDADNCQPPARGRRLADLTGAENVELVGAGHIPNARHPVVVNRLIGEFVARFDGASPRRRTWLRAATRRRQVLLVSLPIGLGHAWRDVAIARELRRLHPDLEVQWLAQPPVTTLLETCGESIHPASAELASEAAGVDAEAGEHEQSLAADYNAQMVEHIARHPYLRDRAIFIGEPEDVVDERLGPELPAIRAWTEQHLEFAGYITGFEAHEIADRHALRAEFGYGPDEKVCIVAPGGSAVGAQLLKRAVEALPEVKRRVPGLRMIVIAGPRLDRESVPQTDGLEVHGYVHQLYRQLAACDLAICHGGLSTTMELTAGRRPFLYFPLKNHFEQNLHVHHRLTRHRAGRRMEFDESPLEAVAEAIVEELGRHVDYEPVPTGGAARAAGLIAGLL